MKKLKLKDSVKEALSVDQMKNIMGGYNGTFCFFRCAHDETSAYVNAFCYDQYDCEGIMGSGYYYGCPTGHYSCE